MKNKKIIILVICFILVALASFCVGLKFSNSKKQSNNFSQPGQFDPRDMNGARKGEMQKGGNWGEMLSGEILSKDTQSITLKLKDGGSKIIFYTDKTTVSKTVIDALNDLIVGNEVSINGTANTDGSINAQTIIIGSIQTSSESKTQ